MNKWVALAATALAVASPAEAKWHKAESPHFVIYANDSARDVTKFAEMLERFHAAMRIVTGREDVIPSPSNRLVIFAVGSEQRVQKLVGDKSKTLAGFYIPRAGGSRAFVSSILLTGDDFPLVILRHEYAHHFLIYTSRFIMPRWMNEGAAEFFASAKFGSDGSVGIGRPANHRAGELLYAADVKVEELLDHELYAKRKGNRYDAFYGRAWALYHYLIFEELEQKARKGQLAAYARAIMAGKSDRDAAVAAFGDLGRLEKDLDAYVRRKTMTYFHFTADKIPAPRITTTALSLGEAAVIPLVIQSQRGVDQEEAAALVPQVRAVAARYPQDSAVLTALAEAEYDAGNDEAAVAAADKAIAIDPKHANAYVQKGYALFRIAEDASDDKKAAAVKAAMQPFEALNKVENDHPLPLIYFYRSFGERGREPNELARHALERASQLAPFDHGLALQTALMQAGEGQIALAKSGLLTLAANPHGGEFAANARALADEIGALKEGTKWTGPAIPPIETVEASDEDGTS